MLPPNHKINPYEGNNNICSDNLSFYLCDVRAHIGALICCCIINYKYFDSLEWQFACHTLRYLHQLHHTQHDCPVY